MTRKKKIHFNPIVRKDLRVISRSMKYSWGLFAYEAILLILFLFVMMITSQGSGYARGNTEVYKYYMAFFPVLGIAQLVMIGLVIPIITASSISGEREKQTLDVLLTTTITPMNIVIGKVASAVIRVMTYVIASIPLMSIAFVVGGLKWRYLFEYVLLAFFYAIFTGSIGTLCSSLCKKSITAIILSYVILYIGVHSITYIPLGIAAIFFDDSIRLMMISSLLNPMQNFIVFFLDRLASEDILEDLGNSVAKPNAFLDFLFQTNVWLVISNVFQLSVAVVFMKLASLKLRPASK